MVTPNGQLHAITAWCLQIARLPAVIILLAGQHIVDVGRDALVLASFGFKASLQMSA
jgi:hypothetical protein